MVVAWVTNWDDDVWAHVGSMEEFWCLKWSIINEALVKKIIYNFKKLTLSSQIGDIYIPMDFEFIGNIFKLSKEGIMISRRKPY
jgi:hypothetical protein